MKKLIPILLSALMFTGCAGTSNNQTNTYRSITMDEAVDMMAKETGYIILDCAVPMSSPQGISRTLSMLPTKPLARLRSPNCQIRTSSFLYTAAAVAEVKRHLKSWSSWATRISWSSVESSIGRAKLSPINIAILMKVANFALQPSFPYFTRLFALKNGKVARLQGVVKNSFCGSNF